MIEYFISRVTGLLSRVTLSCLEKEFKLKISYDDIHRTCRESIEPRVYIQIGYNSNCNKTGEKNTDWKARKWYLSDFMTDDEIIKTSYAAFEACIKHEAMEGFRVDGEILFNPHVDFEELLKISNKEIKRN